MGEKKEDGKKKTRTNRSFHNSMVGFWVKKLSVIRLEFLKYPSGASDKEGLGHCGFYTLLDSVCWVNLLTILILEAIRAKRMRPIFAGNLEYDTRQSELERLFSKYGRIDRVDMKSGNALLVVSSHEQSKYF
ncbi:hypothetical protein V8G54_010577 [Vigna mungo]|uniref:RRM domain-containing protein n=1 Tax=Vigna mungo TaxID=3915 RepID=A0AAQ3NWT5_VIGMU